MTRRSSVTDHECPTGYFPGSALSCDWCPEPPVVCLDHAPRPFCDHACPAHLSALDDIEEKEPRTMTKVFALWHGGSSYSTPDLDSVEVFDSVESAQDAMRDRIAGHHFPATFTYADGRTESTLTPCVSDSSMTVWLSDPRGVADPYPDLMIQQTESDELDVYGV